MSENSKKINPDTFKEAQHQLPQRNILLDSLPVGVFLVANNDQVVAVNQILVDFMQIQPEQFLLQSYRKLFGRMIEFSMMPEVTWRELNSAILEINNNPKIDFSIEGDQKTQCELSFFHVRGEEGVPGGWGGLLKDVTEVKDRNRLKMSLLKTLSQNIRSPLASLKGHSTALMSNHKQWETEMVAEFIETIDRKVDELVRQVDQGLTLIRLESGELNLRLEAISVTSLIQRTLKSIAENGINIPLKYEPSSEIPPVWIDPIGIEKVLVSLLQVVISGNCNESPVEVTAQSKENWVQVSVQSSDFMLTEEAKNELFREDGVISLTGEMKTSLDLNSSRKIIEAHGGQIWVESRLPRIGEGTIISFTLPIMPQQTDSRMSNRRIRQRSEVGKRILVVDDQSDTQSLMRSILRKDGHSVEVAPDGRSALDIVQTSPPDLVVLDWTLPDMSGLSVCRSIQRLATIPVMMVTYKTSLDDLVAAFRAGAADYLTRPFRSDELLVRVQSLLRRHGGEQTLKEDGMFNKAGLRINFNTQEVWAHGERVKLTPIEYSLLIYMARHPRKVLTYGSLIGEVWDSPGAGTRHGLFAHISRLRQKIEENLDKPEFIRTRWGVGYIFMPDH